MSLERTMMAAASKTLFQARDAALKKAMESRTALQKDGAVIAIVETPETELHRRNARLWHELAEEFAAEAIAP